MSWSFSETKALAIKAARGAGMSWGLAEEAGSATILLQRNGLAGVSALAHYLRLLEADRSYVNSPLPITQYITTVSDESLTGQHIDSPITKPLCPIRFGSFLSDSGVIKSVRISGMCSPLLFAPFVLNLLRRQSNPEKVDETSSIKSGSKSLHCHFILPKETLLISATSIVSAPETAEKSPSSEDSSDICALNYFETDTGADDNHSDSSVLLTRVPESEKEAMAALCQFAEKTYAPATESSRLRGAGAGLNDND